MGRKFRIATGSTVARRAFGRLLWQLRHRAGLSVQEAAQLLDIAIASVYRYENGVSGVKSREVEAMCDLYAASERERSALLGLVADFRRESGWWVPNTTVAGYDLRAELEQLANRVRCFDPITVPTPLRTATYTAALGDGTGREPESARNHRVLTFNHRLDAVITETSLRHPVGGGWVMAEQLTHLRELTSQDNVTLRVVPTDVGAYPGLRAGSFEIMDFHTGFGSRPPDPTIVHVKGHLGALYYDALAFPNEVGAYETAFEEISAVALGTAESRQLIADLQTDLDNSGEPSWTATSRH